MAPFDETSPAQGHQALVDITKINSNLTALRQFETSTIPPGNSVEGLLWWKYDTADGNRYKMYQYSNGSMSARYLWAADDLPVLTSELNTHATTSPAATTVHGMKYGHYEDSSGINADRLDGFHESAFLKLGHQDQIATHGATGAIVGTANSQTLTNKSLSTGTTIVADVTVSAGKKIDGRDLSADGAKLDTYPGGGAPANGSITGPSLAALVYSEAYMIVSSDGQKSLGPGQGWTTLKEIYLPRSGTYIVKFEVWDSGPGASGSYACIFMNDSAVGTTRSATPTPTLYSEPIAFTSYQHLRLKAYTAGSSDDIVNVRNLRLYAYDPLLPLVTIS